MPTIFFIFIFGLFQAKNGLGHRIRHGRTRYVSGKNQIFESGHHHDSEEGNFWERPLQILETSMNVSDKRFSRPLFSWDVPGKGNASSRNRFHHSSKENSSAVSLHPSKSVRDSASERRNRVGHDPAGIASSYAYSSIPKRRTNDRKKEETRKRERNWSSNESATKKRKKGRKSGRGKAGTRKTHPVDVFVPGFDSKKSKSFPKKVWTTAGENRTEDSNGNRGKDTEMDDSTSSCDMMENKCEHLCREIAGKPVCMCYKGFRSMGTRCMDVNECEMNDGGCNGKCINTIGSRKCICSIGFRLVEGTCTDVNECLLRNGHGTCQDRCTNTVGSYQCSCDGVPGTRLSSDGHTCEPSQKCDAQSEGCSHSCVSISGRIFCTCPDGFELGHDWKSCRDVDECSSPDDYGVECPSACVNTLGSYKCYELP